MNEKINVSFLSLSAKLGPACPVVLWSVALFTEHSLQFTELEPASNPAADLPRMLALPTFPTNSCVEILVDLTLEVFELSVGMFYGF